MPIPVVTQPPSPRIIAAGAAFSLTLSATNTPTSWAATGLPSGLSISSGGVISGTPVATATTTSTVSITATNGSGDSAAVLLTLTVMATPPGFSGDPFDLILDYEVGVDNAVSIPGKEAPAEGGALFSMPQGTNRTLLIGVKHYGVLQDLNPSSEDLTIRLAFKQFEPEAVIDVTTGTVEKIAGVSDDQQRYRIPVRIDSAKWSSPLSEFESDDGTSINALCELQITRGAAATLYDETESDTGIAIEGNISSATTGDLDFTALDEFAVATPMRLTLTITPAGRALQVVTLIRTFDLIFEGGAFVISNLAGDTSLSGATEGNKWKVTFNLTDITGDADSVTPAYSFTTSADTSQIYYTFELPMGEDLTTESSIPAFAPIPSLYLYDEEDSLIGSEEFPDGYDDGADLLAALAAGWDSAAGASEVISVVPKPGVPTTALFTIAASSSVATIGFDSTEPPGTTYGYTAAPTNPEGTPTTCSVSGRLEQLSDPSSVPLNLTSDQFRVRVARDIVPDPS